VPPPSVRSRIIGAALAALTIPAAASAAVTSSQVTTPADVTFRSYDGDSGTTQNITASGASDGTAGDAIEVRCYSGSAQNVNFQTLGATTATAGGAWTITASIGNISGGVCTLRAVPPTLTTAPSGFGGARVFVGERKAAKIAAGPNINVIHDFTVDAPQIRGAAIYRSLGRGGLYDAWTLGASDLAASSEPFFANNYLPLADFANTRSTAQVGGQNAYTPSVANGLFAGSDALSGFPGIAYSVAFTPNGGVTINEAESLVKCTLNTFPATAGSCTSFSSTGVRVVRTMAQDLDGRRTTITDAWSSTDGQPHQLDLLIRDEAENTSGGSNQGPAFLFPWTANPFQIIASGASIPGAPGPGTISVKTSANASDGDQRFPQGAITFDTPPSGIKFQTAAVVRNFQSNIVRTVPATGALTMKRVYSWGDTAAELAVQTAQDSDPLAVPTVAITSPANASTVTNANVIATGTAKDNVGVASLTVNGRAIVVASDGSWAAPLVLTAGLNTITAVAKDAAGGTTTATATVTYAPPVTPVPPPVVLCVAPKLAGLTLANAKASLAKGNCTLGRVSKVANRKKVGRVLSQAVPSGWSSAKGTAIPITIGKAVKAKKK
jgi:hypothetical protein